MIVAYFDESGTHKGAQALTVGGFVAPLRDWDLFQTLWGQQSKSAGVSCYHAADLESLQGEYRRKGWTADEKLRFQRSFISCLGVISPWGLASGISYAEFQSNSDLQALVRTPYALCALRCVLEVLDRAEGIGETEPVHFIFDRGPEGAGELNELLTALAPREPLLGPWKFEDKVRFRGLQAADFHAYEAWKFLENRVVDGVKRDERGSFRAAFEACTLECWMLDWNIAPMLFLLGGLKGRHPPELRWFDLLHRPREPELPEI